VQGLEHAAELNRGAVGVGDDLVVIEDGVVHSRHDEGDAVGEAIRVRLVDTDRAAPHGVGDELTARLRTDREEAEIETAGGQHVRCRLIDGQLAAAVANGAPC
jgi:hypothetical protein